MFLVFLVALAVAAIVTAVPRTFEKMVPMRDGVKLHTRVILPRNYELGQKFTTVVDRSPYGYTGLEMIADLYLPFGFATVGQDMRGTQKSEGNFTIWHSDANDSQDLGDWIVKQGWSNGVVFSMGASADGLAAFTMPENNPEWLKAQYFIWTSSVGYDVVYPNGAYLEALANMWIRSTVPDDADQSLQIIRENEMKTSWWDPLDLTGKYNLAHGMSGFWAGWYDIFLVGNLKAYEGYNTESDPSVRYSSLITVDPLGHCQDAAQYFPQDLIAGRTLLAMAQSLQVYGVRPVTRTNIRNVTFYVMSSNDEAGLQVGQYWTSLDRFPEPVMTRFFLHSDGSASTLHPNSEETESSSFVHDPSNPIPSQGGNNLAIPCGPMDQGEIDKRSDVLVFQSPVFMEELAMTGPIFAHLFVSSDAIDTDFMVRISDVYPTGEVRLLQDSAIRMRWREGGLTPVFMSKGEVYEAKMSLWNTSYVLAPGHALRFSIASSNYPRFSVNRNNGVLLASADPGPNITATNVIHHSPQYPSFVSLPVVDRVLQLPKIHNVKLAVEEAFPKLDTKFILRNLDKFADAFSMPPKRVTFE